MNKTILILTIIIAILQAINIFMLTDASTRGFDLGKKQEQTTTLREQNMGLEEKILEAESFQNIKLKALAAGFIPATYIYLHK